MKIALMTLVLSAGIAGCADKMSVVEMDDKLGVQQLCAMLEKGDPGDARISIAPRPAGQARSIPGIVKSMFKQEDEPFREIPPARIYAALPKDRGPLEACRSGSLSFTDREITKEMYLSYPKRQLTVTLRYGFSTSPRLTAFDVGALAPRQAGREEPDAASRRMGELVDRIEKLKK